ncbi:MAG: hypothetical protein ACLQQB_05640 [Solirubrobacteraceae bacterium]|jgi:hypothetical protein
MNRLVAPGDLGLSFGGFARRFFEQQFSLCNANDGTIFPGESAIYRPFACVEYGRPYVGPKRDKGEWAELGLDDPSDLKAATIDELRNAE